MNIGGFPSRFEGMGGVHAGFGGWEVWVFGEGCEVVGIG